MNKLLCNTITSITIISLLMQNFTSLTYAQTPDSSASIKHDTLALSATPGLFASTDPTIPVPDFGTQLQQSANIGTPPVVQKLPKHFYRSDENVYVSVANAQNQSFHVDLFDQRGQSADVNIQQTNANNQVTFSVQPRAQFRPGKYRLVVTDANGNNSTQDFTWGVLAINPDRSIYTPGQTADLAMAVLDDQGNMVCDANVDLKITHPVTLTNLAESNQITDLSTTNGKITVNPQCQSHGFSLKPDYEAQYTLDTAGTYDMTLTATTNNGSYSITDSLVVKDSVPFDVQRVSATRIYPPNNYPVQINVTANQDFDGTITETVPDSFTITSASDSANQSYTDMQTVYLDPKSNPENNLTMEQLNNGTMSSTNAGSNVLGASTSANLTTPTNALLIPFIGNYPITEGFGAQMTDPRLVEIYHAFGLAGHDGIDFGVPVSTPIVAADDGTVALAGPGDYGTTIIIQHAWGKSYYGHLSKVLVTANQHVSKGQQIALSGNTGESTGPHLHFGIKPNNPDMTNGYYGKIDPIPYFHLPNFNTLTDSLTSDHLSTSSATPFTRRSLGEGGPTTPTVLSASTSATLTSHTSLTFPTAQPLLSPATILTTSTVDKVKVLTWNISMKKGDKVSLGYTFKAPQISPQFYLLGPLTFYEASENQQKTRLSASSLANSTVNTNASDLSSTNLAENKQFVNTRGPEGNRTPAIRADRSEAVPTAGPQLTVSQNNNNNINTNTNPCSSANNPCKSIFAESRQWQLASDAVGTAWYDYKWQYRKQITIDHTKVSGTNNITQDATSHSDDNSGGTVASLSWTHVVASQSNMILIVGVSLSSTSSSVTGITWNTNQNFTVLDTENAPNGEGLGLSRLEMWYLLAPASGSHTIKVSVSPNSHIAAGAVSYYNVDQTTPFGTDAKTNGTNTGNGTTSLNVTTTSSTQLVVDTVDTNSTLGAVKAGSTQLWNDNFVDGSGGSSKPGTGSTVNVGWTANFSDWAEVAAPMNPSSTALSNFPVLVNLSSDNDLKNNAQSSGNDILFTDSTGQTKLNHEIETYTSGTGALVAWVNVPTVSLTSDTMLYMYYGNAAASDQESVNSTWNSNFKAVYHLKESGNGTAGEFKDSTSNGNSGTGGNGNSSQTPTQTSGQIGNGQNFNSTNTQWLVKGSASGIPNFNASQTLSLWYKVTSNPGGEQILLNTQTSVTNDANANQFEFESNGTKIGVTDSNASTLVDAADPSANAWHMATWSWDGTTDRLYIDGSQSGITTNSPQATSGNAVSMGTWVNNNAAGGTLYNGLLDEVEISNSVRYTGWITTEYNNQNSPSTFYTLGSVETKTYAPTLDQVMRGGKWFCPSVAPAQFPSETTCVSNTGKQPYVF